jgi:hypothetical protein
MSKHTKEPWGVTKCFCSKPECNNYTLDQASAGGWLNEANARRIVACVNACARVSTDDLEDVQGNFGAAYVDARDRAIRYKNQRDELLAELTAIANADPAKWDPEMRDQFREWAQSRASAAISKVEQA